jgi:hypothetical protein
MEEFMKKCAVFVICFLSFFVLGCVTNVGMFDDGVPPEKQSTLEIPFSLTVKKFDETEVSWNVGFWGRAYGVGKAVVDIPDGNHILIIDYLTQTETGSYIEVRKANGLMVTYDFLPLHKYRLVPNIRGDLISIGVEEIKK